MHKMLFYNMFKLNRFQYTRSPVQHDQHVQHVQHVQQVHPVQHVQHVQHVQPVQRGQRTVRSRSVAQQIISMRGIMIHQAKSCGACGRK